MGIHVDMAALQREHRLRDREQVELQDREGNLIQVLFHTRRVQQPITKAEVPPDVTEYDPTIVIEVVLGADVLGPRRCVLLSTDLDELHQIHSETLRKDPVMTRAWFDYLADSEERLRHPSGRGRDRQAVLGWSWRLKRPTITHTFVGP